MNRCDPTNGIFIDTATVSHAKKASLLRFSLLNGFNQIKSAAKIVAD